MKIKIPMEDPRGDVLSPMDEKTITDVKTLDVDMWCEKITIMEEDSDGNSEAGSVNLVHLLQDFLDLIGPPADEDIDVQAERATENLPDLVRTAATFHTCQLIVATEIDRYRKMIVDADDKHNAVCDAENEKSRQRLAEKRRAEKK